MLHSKLDNEFYAKNQRQIIYGECKMHENHILNDTWHGQHFQNVDSFWQNHFHII